jgi:hypothetical protein
MRARLISDIRTSALQSNPSQDVLGRGGVLHSFRTTDDRRHGCVANADVEGLEIVVALRRILMCEKKTPPNGGIAWPRSVSETAMCCHFQAVTLGQQTRTGKCVIGRL